MKEWERFNAFKSNAQYLIEKYSDELGENAYGALSVITDIASRPNFYSTPSWMVDNLQRRAGKWFKDFSEQITIPGFNLDQYISDARLIYIEELTDG